jgi:peptidoglycan/xylan/chitin deacetylase (PgdA/CDA1 family)
MCTWRGSGGAIAGKNWPGSESAGNGQDAEIAITFDDGPDPKSTIPLLDRLDDLGIKATFFCLGTMMESYPDLVQEIMHRGHEVGIHGYDHVAHLLRSPRWIWQDITRAKLDLERIHGHESDSPDSPPDALPGDSSGAGHVRWFRPPKGVITGTTLIAAKYYGLDIVLWSAWGKEWTTNDPVQVANRVIRRLDDGVIVLLHDADTTSPPGTWKVAYEALPRIIEEAGSRGLHPVALSTLFRCSDLQLMQLRR